MDPLHASLTDNLSDPNQTSKIVVIIQIQTVRHTDGIGWYFKSRLASVLKKLIHQKKIRVSFVFSWRYKTGPSQDSKIPIFHSSTLT